MTLAPSSRYTKYDPVVSTDTFLVGFPLFDSDDLRVVVDGVQTEAYSVSATYVDRVAMNASITLVTAVAGVTVEIYGARIPRRDNSYLGNSPNLADSLQHDADVLTATQQEITRESERMLRLPVDSGISPYLPDLEPGTTIIVNDAGDGFSAGPKASDIAGANQSAIDAEAPAQRAEAAENSLLEWQGQWVTATLYRPGDLVGESGNTYVCLTEHTSGTFAVDLGNGLWEIFAQKGAAGAGSGDMLNSENLSGLTDKPLAFSTIKQAASTSATGVVEKATPAEMTAGSADKFPDASTIKTYLDNLPFWHYEHELAYTAVGQVLTFTHNLGEVPAVTQISLVCTAADAGYSVGDVIHNVSSATTGTNDRSHDAGFTLTSVNANEFKLEVSFRGINLRSKMGGAGSIGVFATPGRWKFVVRARLSEAVSGLTATVADGDRGDIVVSGGGTSWAVKDKAVTPAKMADLPAGRLLGRVASSGSPQALTAAEARGLLGVAGSDYATIADMALQSDFADGQTVSVVSGWNGQREDFTYSAASTATADGALIVEATGMGAGRLVSARTTYGTVAEMLADRRAFADGVELVAGGYRYETVSSAAHLTLAGGQGVTALPVNATFAMLALAPNADGTTDDSDKIDALNLAGYVLDLGGKDYEYAGAFTTLARIVNGRITDDDRTYDYRVSTGETAMTAGQGRARINYQTGTSVRVDGLPDALVMGGFRSFGQYLKARGRVVSTGLGEATHKVVALADQGALNTAKSGNWYAVFAVANKAESTTRFVVMPYLRCYSVAGSVVTLGEGDENKNIAPATITYDIDANALAGADCLVITENGNVSRRMTTITANTTTTVTLADATGVAQLDFLLPAPPDVDDYHYLGTFLFEVAGGGSVRNIADDGHRIHARMVNAADCPASGAASVAQIRFGGNISPLATGVEVSFLETLSTTSTGSIVEQVWHDSSTHDIFRTIFQKQASGNAAFDYFVSATFSKQQSVWLNTTGALAAAPVSRSALVYGWVEP